MDTNRIECALAGDSQAALPMAVVIASAARRLSPPWRLRFHIIDCGLERRQVNRLRGCCADRAVDVSVITAPLEKLSDFPTCRHFTAAANSRLLLSSLLPDLDRVIYMDSDMVIDRDLSELWSTNLQGRGLAAAHNAPGPRQMGDQAAMAYAAADLPDRDDTYFNSGLLLADLARWRHIGVECAARSFFASYSKATVCPDQDALNFIFSGRYHKLESRWNEQCASTCANRLPPIRDRNVIDIDRIIYHLTGAHKPWNGGIRHPSLWSYAQEVGAAGWLHWWEWPAYLTGAMVPPGLRKLLFPRRTAMMAVSSGRTPDVEFAAGRVA